MDIITFIITLAIGVCIGYIICSIQWLKQLSDDMLKLDIEIAKLDGEIAGIKSELSALEEQGNGNDEAIPKGRITKAINKVEDIICNDETNTVKAQGMAQALDIFVQILGEVDNENDD